MDLRDKAILRFYNYFSGNSVESVQDIPIEVLIKIQAYNLKELCKPFAFEDGVKGSSIGKISQKYGLTSKVSRNIFEKANS